MAGMFLQIADIHIQPVSWTVLHSFTVTMERDHVLDWHLLVQGIEREQVLRAACSCSAQMHAGRRRLVQGT